MKALEETLETEDAGKIKGGIQNLTDAAMKLGEAIYKQSQNDDVAAAEADAKRDGGGPDDDVVDADFEDITDGEDRKA